MEPQSPRAKAVMVPESLMTSPLYFLAVPLQTYQALSAEATQRGMTLAQALSTAINDFLSSSKEG